MAKCKDCKFYGVCILDRRSPDADVAGCKIFEVGERDLVEVVRCKDCKWSEDYRGVILCNHSSGMFGKVTNESFCSCGERRADNA